MTSFPALDVALGLIFLYFVLALVCSGINEAIASLLRWRAQDLERGLWELLRDPNKGSETLEKLKAHPLIEPMLYPKNKGVAAPSPPLKGDRPKTSRKTDFPSYIPSRTFVTALLGFEQRAVSVAQDGDVREELRKVDESIRRIPSERVQQALTSLLHSAQGDAIAFRRSVEQWYDDHMERVSGWYRRRIQKVLWLLAFLVAITLNADSLQLARHLWVEPSVRASLVNQAQTGRTGTAGETNPTADLDSLPVPLGWHLATMRDDPQGFPVYAKWTMVWALLSKLVGLSLTAVAITFGAPFWFDTLSKLARVRNSGAPPPASDAVRRGEGEETRRGESAALATALAEAAGKSTETEARRTQ
ncbi:MAG: hypothetical protein M3312_01315 [Actinomycetota bacterium]|nr:hypothetical protein [Actinomycetota bacterium]